MSDSQREDDTVVVPAPPGYTSQGGTGEAVVLSGPGPNGPGTPIAWPPPEADSGE